MSETSEIYLQLGQVIYSSASKVCINIENGQLDVFSAVPVPDQAPIKLVQAIGGHSLSKLFRKPMPLYKRIITKDVTARKHRRTENILIRTTLGFESIARQLSIVHQTNEEEIRTLLDSLLKLRMQRIFLFTKANGLGIKNSDAERFGIDNQWVASGSLADAKPNYLWVNQQLKRLKSPIRVRVPSLFITKVLSPNA